MEEKEQSEVVGVDEKKKIEEHELKNEESLQHSTTGLCPCDHQFSMNVADYQLGAVIGFGSSAIVYMAKYLPLSMDVAVKMIELDHFERNRIDELRKEIQVMAFCKHPNLLGNLTSFVHESKLWIVTPFLSGGSCLDIMKSGFKDGFDEPVIATILFQALQGLEYLHENGHIHRDVKCGNLLMAEDGLVQLADFGVSSSLMEDGERHGMRKTYVGTPCWMAPEVMEITRGYDFKADIWSFGITALELAYGHAPYAKFPPMKVIYLTISGKPPTLDKKQASRKYSRMFKDMIDCCLQRDPAKRPTAKALLKHPFFKTMTRKPQFLVSSVLDHIQPVNLRDKTAQLRARGIPVPLTGEEGNSEANGGVGGAGNNEANRSFLSQVVGSDEYENDDTSESWDFSLDNSVEPDSGVPLTASVFDVIVEEDENEAAESENEEADNNKIELEPLESEAEIPEINDPLPEARPLDDSETEISFHGLQKNRTSRFILAAEANLKEAMNRLDLSSTVIISNDNENHEIVGSITDLGNLIQSPNNSTPPVSSRSSSSSETQILIVSSNSHARSSSPNDVGETVPTEVKKGRFSVLEAVNTSDIDPVPEGDLLENGGNVILSTSSPTTNAAVNHNYEEEKRSRFEVSLNVPVSEISDSEDPENSENGDKSGTINSSSFQGSFDPTQQNQNSSLYATMYHNSAPIISGPNFASYHHSLASQGYPLNPPAPFYSVYPPPPSQTGPQPQPHHHHRPSLTSSVPFYPLQSPHPAPTIPTQSVPLSPVNPAQLDHLLHVNDYIRNQLVELKYRQEILQLHQHQQQQQQVPPHSSFQYAQVAQGMRPHSTFNPHNYVNPNSNEMLLHPHQHHQLHHSHPVMPPAEPAITEHHHQNYYSHLPPPQQQHGSLTNSVSPAPPESITSSTSSAQNPNFALILKELENIKKENEILKAYLTQQQQQQQ